MNLNTLVLIILSCCLLVFGSFFYLNTKGPSIKPIQAALVCSKVVQSKVSTPFKLLRYEFSNRHSLLYVKSELLLLYDNDFKATATCFIKRNNPKNTIQIKEALIINDNGYLFKVSDIKVEYSNQK